MKRMYLIFAACLLGFAVSLFSQVKYKYGKVDADELAMTVYEKDTSAVAVVLYEEGNTNYTYNSSIGFQVLTDIKRRVKILKPEGTGQADVSIPYYYKNSGEKESISSLEAYAYNLEDKKVVKTKLDKKYVFDEEISSRYRQMKFSIPNVQAGTVMEYKYRVTSPFVLSIPSWDIQKSIPVQYSLCEVLIPEYFFFNVDAAKGFVPIKAEESTENQNFNIGYYSNGQTAQEVSNSRLLKFTAQDVPALKSEPYVWCVNDFASGVSFEISGTKYPNDFYKPYTTTWNSIEKTLMNETNFGSNIKITNPYKEEVKVLTSMGLDEEAVIDAIYTLVKNKIRWNGNYGFWANDVRTAVKNGTGDNSQINVVLLSMLKDAGIKAYPVLLSLRSRGRIPYTHPSLDRLNSFVVVAETADGKCLYMDGSAVQGGLNVLPTELLVDRAWVLNEHVNGDKWINLSHLGYNQMQSTIKAEIDETGRIVCERKVRYSGQLAYDFKNKYFSEKDSASYIKSFEERNKVEITAYSLDGMMSSANVVEEVNFVQQPNDFTTSEYIYMNPLIFIHLEQNPFTQSERKLPIEFNYPYVYAQMVSLTIPKDYAVDEMPEPLSLALPDKAGKCLYQVTKSGENILQVMYRFELNQLIFPPTDYEIIKEFFGRVAAKNGEYVVLKKI